MQVKIYTTATCPFCRMEKQYLDSKNIKYENIFVDVNEQATAEMVKISGQMGVPFTVITQDDGTITTVLGFDREKLNQALGIN